MSDESDVPFARRAIGAAIVTGASGAGLAFSLARPLVREGLETAVNASQEIRRASSQVAEGALRSAFESTRPTLDTALDLKDRLRRRAFGSLPPGFGGMLEEWRREFIEGEKAVYFGGVRAAGELRPAVEMAQQRSRALLDAVIGAFGDVVDTSLVSMMKVGEELQSGAPLNRPTRKSAKKRVRRV